MDSRDAVTFLLLDAENGQDEPERIAGYFALSAGQIDREDVPGDMGKAAPDPIPAVRMGRFAVDQSYQGTGLRRRTCFERPCFVQ